MKAFPSLWARVFLLVVLMSLAVELTLAVFLSLTEDALSQRPARAGHVSALAKKMSLLGQEKTAVFFEFPDPSGDDLWLENQSGEVVFGRANPDLAFFKRQSPPKSKAFYGEIAVWDAGSLSLFRAPVWLNGDKYFLFLAPREFFSLKKADHFVQGFFVLLIVAGFFAFLAVKFAQKPLKRLHKELIPVAEGGDLSLRVSALGDGILAQIAKEINLLIQAAASQEDSLAALALFVSQSRNLLAGARFTGGNLEESLFEGDLKKAKNDLAALRGAHFRLDRILGELALIRRLKQNRESFRRELLSLSALTFEASVHFKEASGGRALYSEVASELYVLGDRDLIQILLARLLEQTLRLATRQKVALALEKRDDLAVLSLTLINSDLTLKELESFFWLKPAPFGDIEPSLALAREIATFSDAKFKVLKSPGAAGAAYPRIEILFPLAAPPKEKAWLKD
jgi:hypothetical protein